MWAMLSRAGQGRPTCSGSTPAPHPLSLDADNPRRGENPAAFAMVHRQEKKTKAEADGLLYSSRAIDRDCRRGWQIFFSTHGRFDLGDCEMQIRGDHRRP